MSAAAACSLPDNPGTTFLGFGMPHPLPPYPAAAAGVQAADDVKQLLQSKRTRRKELRPPQRACSENYTGLLDAMPIHMYQGTKPIIDYATPIVIEPQAEREPGRMQRLFNKGQSNLCSQYTDFHCTYNTQSPSPSLPRDSGVYEGYQDFGVSYDGKTPPPVYPAGEIQEESPVEQLKCEEYPTLGTVSMVQSAPIVIEPVVDDMAQMKQAYGSAHTAPSRTPSHMTTVPQGCLNGYNSCYQTPPPLHQWPGPAVYFGHSGQYTALGTLTPYYPVNYNHIPPSNQKHYQLLREMLSPKMMNSSPWRDDAQRQARPGHPYHSNPPPAQRTLAPRPLLIQPVSMDLRNVPGQIPPQAGYKPEDDDRAIMMRCYAKKERETSVNISGTCYLHVDDMNGMRRKSLPFVWYTQTLEMAVENQIVEFDVDEREISVNAQKTGPRSKTELIDDHYRSLEKQLPRHVKAHINSLTHKAAKHEGGIFFDNTVNKDLMHIEQACVKLSAFNHKLVYEHLSQHLPCSKETLQRHVETLALAVMRRKLRNLMDSLFHRLKKEMPYQMERHLWECSVATKLQFQQQAMIAQSPTKGRLDVTTINHQQHSSSEPVDQHHIPGQTFLWTDVTRQLIWDILKTKLSTYPPKKGVKAKMANFERLKEFVQRRVVSAWPEGWMDTETVLAESRTVQQSLRGTIDLFVR